MEKKPSEAAVVEFAQAVGRIVRRARAEGESNGLSWTESSVLAWLAKNGPMTTAELARNEGMKPQSMGTVVAGLEESGLVAKEPHETDGRRMYVVLTEKGVALRKSTSDTKRAWIAKVIATLSEEEQATLFEAGRLMRRMTDGEGQ
jgi:DNA-binding MarR family transcriptional regulator